MYPDDEVHGHRPAWWVLRYVNGEAFAISDLPEEGRWRNDMNPDVVWQCPAALSRFIDAGDETIIGYRVEAITQIEFETYREFGMPVVDTLNEVGCPVL